MERNKTHRGTIKNAFFNHYNSERFATGNFYYLTYAKSHFNFLETVMFPTDVPLYRYCFGTYSKLDSAVNFKETLIPREVVRQKVVLSKWNSPVASIRSSCTRARQIANCDAARNINGTELTTSGLVGECVLLLCCVLFTAWCTAISSSVGGSFVSKGWTGIGCREIRFARPP